MIPSTNYPAIHPRQDRRGSARWIILAAAAGTACAVTASGCSSGNNGQSATRSTAAQKAIKLAASRSQGVRTLTASLAEHSDRGAPGGLTGTIQLQLKPATLISAQFLVPQQGSAPIKLEEILTGKAIYFKDPAFSKQTGKAWVTVPLAHLTAKTGLTLASLLQNLEGSNPLDQTTLFTASKDVKVVGSQAVNGVATTEYSGSYSPSVAFAQLSPKLRKLLGPTLRAMGSNRVRFQVWIDAQHVIRKARDTETLNAQTFTTTFDVTSVNKPVKITIPARSQVAPMPKL